MSEIKVDKINNLAGTGAANFTYGIKVGGVAQSFGAGTFTNSDTEPTSPSDGDIWYQPTLMYFDYRAGGEWKRVVGSGSANPAAFFGDRMVTAGGNSPATSAIRYIDLTGSGSSSSFGSLTSARNGAGAATGDTRGIFAGGVVSGYINNIEYVTIPTTGNSTDFGDLVEVCMPSVASDGIYAIFAMVDGNNTADGSVSKITIATTGNATAWSGTLTTARGNGTGASDGTKGFFFGGWDVSASGRVNTIDYVTIATDANASDWGDMTVQRNQNGNSSACGNTSRVLVAGGNTGSGYTDAIDYINPASASNAYDFGNLTSQMRFLSGSNNATKACWVGGSFTNGTYTNTQQIVTIDTTGNASSFGTYNASLHSIGSCSGAAS